MVIVPGEDSRKKGDSIGFFVKRFGFIEKIIRLNRRNQKDVKKCQNMSKVSRSMMWRHI